LQAARQEVVQGFSPLVGYVHGLEPRLLRKHEARFAIVIGESLLGERV